jgi:small subunit ribosomal protein S16
MVKIRLFRTGVTKRPSYRIVAIESRRKRQGPFLDILGTYDPRGGGTVHLQEERLESWLTRGAQPSQTVRSLIRRWRRTRAELAPESAPPAS